MSSDRSRLSDYPRDLYAGIVAQQGRVVLDRDINALQEIALGSLAADARDIIGPCGTPDDGFLISLPGTPGAPFYSPPGESPPSGLGTFRDFLIGPGTMYLGGYRVLLPARPDGAAVAYSYADQLVLPPSGPGPTETDILNRPRIELVYLDVSLREVSAVEDPDLLDAALGGPDTTQRLRLLPRVERFTVSAASCASAWAQAVKYWAGLGLKFDPALMTLEPALRLLAGFTQDAGTGDPCDPVAAGGYLYADNQLIRVQIAEIGDTPSVVWGYDNASFMYRIASVSPDGLTLTLAGGPPDAAHYPQSGQLVEILTTASVVAAEPDETAPAGAPANILRVAAEAVGAFYTLAKPYGPATQGDPTYYMTLSEPLEAGMAESPLPLFLRVWQNQLPFAFDTAITLLDQNNVSNGITVTFSGAKIPAIGAYWQIAARPATPQGLYPEDLLVSPLPPDGPARFVCPLAVIDWFAKAGPAITDCRLKFDNLVELTRRKPGCCTVSISAGDLAGASMQSLVDRAAAAAQSVTICLAAGTYALAEPLRLGAHHSGLTFESCGGSAVFTADPTADLSVFVDGLIALNGAANITFEGLSFEPPLVPMPASVRETLQEFLGTGTQGEEELALLRNPFLSFGVRAFYAASLTLDRCNFTFAPPAGAIIDVIAAGVLLQGDCSGLTVKNCQFVSTIPLTYNAITTVTGAAQINQEAARARAVSPPATPVTSRLDFSNPETLKTLIGDVITNRGGVIGEKRLPMTATAGIIALDAVTSFDGNGQFYFCHLGDAVLRENWFTGLTFGAVTMANFTSFRAQDNNIAGGIGGLWLTCGIPTWPNDAIGGNTYENSANFEEFNLLGITILTLAPPAVAGQALPPGGSPTETSTAPVYSAVMISGNRITTGIHPPPSDQAGAGTAFPGSSALLLWLNSTTPIQALQNSCIATVINGNQFLTSSFTAPAALLVLPDAQPCAITGNTIMNLPGALLTNYVSPPSLWVVMGIQTKVLNQPLAATGNVLRGASDLDLFDRAQGGARAGWSGYNADPD